MSHSPGEKPALSPDDVLPPVEPPSAGFIIQLFVVPGVIVVIIVLVWLMTNWLAQMGSGPEQYVQALARHDAARWQAAYNLAVALQESGAGGKPSIRGDAALAGKVAEILDRELTSGEKDAMQEEAVKLRFYLCQTLGDFQTPVGLPALLRAAKTERDAAEVDVRRSALKAIGKLAANLRALAPPQTLAHADLETTLLDAAGSDNAQVREAAAAALGMVDTPPLRARLVEMLGDTSPNARYNAAIHLARQGNPQVIPLLVEMLDPQQTVGLSGEKNEAGRRQKRQMLTLHGLDATRRLAEADPSLDLSPLVAQLEKLTGGELEAELRTIALDLTYRLKARRPAAAPTPN